MTWGPWIEHDGRGCPSEIMPGKFMQARYRNGKLHAGLINENIAPAPNWIWPKEDGTLFATDCIAYRIRKPRGMEILEQALKVEEPA